jgi:putative flavoprotein involved in K+ transport
MRSRSIDTVIVGAGQSGLVTSWFLREAGREHVLLDRRTSIGGGWHDRWNAFRLVTPNSLAALPGFGYTGPDPDGFMARAEVIARLETYAELIRAPIELATEVVRLEPQVPGRGGARFRLSTSRGPIQAHTVVVASGPFQVPHIPPIAAGFGPGVHQLHAHEYREPGGLPPGGVLIIGSGQTGVQLAEELMDAGRPVTLAVGHCGRTLRRYRGKDTFSWVHEIAVRGRSVGVPLPTATSLPDGRLRYACNPHVSGHHGGHDTNLRQMAAAGLRLVGRLRAADGRRAWFAGDLAENLRYADGFFDERLRPLIDRYIERTGTAAPGGEVPQFAFDPPDVPTLDLPAEGISTVLWTSGYRAAFEWIELPVFDELGLPRQVDGISEVQGLAFIGMPWLVDMTSANLAGMPRDAEGLIARLERARTLTSAPSPT